MKHVFLLLLLPIITTPFLTPKPSYHHRYSHVTLLHSTLLPRETLLQSLTTQYSLDPILSARLLDLAQSALQHWTIERSPFLRPPEIAAISSLSIPDIEIRFTGGYTDAERQRAVFSRTDLPVDWSSTSTLQEETLLVLEVNGNFKFDKPSHRDYLGAVLGTGIERDRVGDILISDDGTAQIVVDPDISSHLEMVLTSVRTVSVQVKSVPLEQLIVPESTEKEIISVESSMRLDAVGSAGIGMSRSKLVEKIKRGDVLVNWREEKKTSREVEEGDVVTVRGKGRVKVKDVERTGKGKFRVVMGRSV